MTPASPRRSGLGRAFLIGLPYLWLLLFFLVLRNLCSLRFGLRLCLRLGLRLCLRLGLRLSLRWWFLPLPPLQRLLLWLQLSAHVLLAFFT